MSNLHISYKKDKILLLQRKKLNSVHANQANVLHVTFQKAQLYDITLFPSNITPLANVHGSVSRYLCLKILTIVLCVFYGKLILKESSNTPAAYICSGWTKAQNTTWQGPVHIYQGGFTDLGSAWVRIFCNPLPHNRPCNFVTPSFTIKVTHIYTWLTFFLITTKNTGFRNDPQISDFVPPPMYTHTDK